MVDYVTILYRHYTLTKKNTPEFSKIKVGPMTMKATCFDAEGLGHVSLTCGKAMFGLMKMDTLVINPFEKDIPLFSLDRISAAGKETLLIELAETRLLPCPLDARFEGLAAQYGTDDDYTPEPRWYDSLQLPGSIHKKDTKKAAARYDRLTEEFLNLYCEVAKNAPTCDPSKKRAAAKVYSDGLLEQGGVSTDVFVERKGRDFTERFFRECMFGA